MLIESTTETLNEDLSTGKVVVDFYAPWCAPCKMVAPLFEQAAAQHSDVKYVKVNIDEVDGAHKYNVRSIPTLMVLQDGEVKKTHVGAITGPKLQEFVA